MVIINKTRKKKAQIAYRSYLLPFPPPALPFPFPFPSHSHFVLSFYRSRLASEGSAKLGKLEKQASM